MSLGTSKRYKGMCSRGDPIRVLRNMGENSIGPWMTSEAVVFRGYDLRESPWNKWSLNFVDIGSVNIDMLLLEVLPAKDHRAIYGHWYAQHTQDITKVVGRRSITPR